MSTEMEVDGRDLKIQAALERIIDIARKSGYKVKWVPGRNGACAYWANRIEIGKEFSLIEKLVVLSHEIGHALDYVYNFPEPDELVLMVGFLETYKLGKKYNEREASAWHHAEAVLRGINIWGEVKEKFLLFKTQSLDEYSKRHLKAKREGKDAPSPAELKAAYSKMTGIF